MARELLLTCVEGDQPDIVVTRDLLIGRFGEDNSCCDYEIDNGYISQKHCTISLLVAGQSDDPLAVAVVVDLSRNGCWVNDERVEKGESTVLREGDRLTLCKPRKPNDGQITITYKVQLREAPSAVHEDLMGDATTMDTVSVGYDDPDENTSTSGQWRPMGSRSDLSSIMGQKIVPVEDLRKTGVFEDDYIKEIELGKGNYGTVWRVKNRHTGDTYAAKLVKDKFSVPGAGGGRYGGKGNKRKNVLREEIQILTSVRHPCVIRMIDAYGVDDEKSTTAWIIMEFCDSGELYGKMEKKRHGRFGEIHARTLCKQVLRGISYLHGKGIIHRDLKPDNILLHKYIFTPRPDEVVRKRLTGAEAAPHHRYMAKIADFGMSRLAHWQEGNGLSLDEEISHIQAPPSAEGAGHTRKANSLITASKASSVPMRRVNSIVGTVRFLAPEVFLRWKRVGAAREVRQRRAAVLRAKAKREDVADWDSIATEITSDIVDDGFGFAPGASSFDLIMPWLPPSHSVRVWYEGVLARRTAEREAELKSGMRAGRAASVRTSLAGAPVSRIGVKRGRDEEPMASASELFEGLTPEEIEAALKIDKAVLATKDRNVDLSDTPHDLGKERVSIAACLAIDRDARHGYDGIAADAYSMGSTIFVLLSGENMCPGKGPNEDPDNEQHLRLLVVPESERLGRGIEHDDLVDDYESDNPRGFSTLRKGDWPVLPSLLQQLLLGNVAFPSSPFQSISAEARDLIMRMTRPDPRKRLTAFSARSHPWIEGTVLDPKQDFEASVPRFAPKVETGDNFRSAKRAASTAAMAAAVSGAISSRDTSSSSGAGSSFASRSPARSPRGAYSLPYSTQQLMQHGRGGIEASLVSTGSPQRWPGGAARFPAHASSRAVAVEEEDGEEEYAEASQMAVEESWREWDPTAEVDGKRASGGTGAKGKKPGS